MISIPNVNALIVPKEQANKGNIIYILSQQSFLMLKVLLSI